MATINIALQVYATEMVKAIYREASRKHETPEQITGYMEAEVLKEERANPNLFQQTFVNWDEVAEYIKTQAI